MKPWGFVQCVATTDCPYEFLLQILCGSDKASTADGAVINCQKSSKSKSIFNKTHQDPSTYSRVNIGTDTTMKIVVSQLICYLKAIYL